MRQSLLGLMICCSLSVHGRAAAEEAKPTPETLAKWLEGKEVVEVEFAGPHMDPVKLKDSLKTKMTDDRDFLLTPGEGGGVNRSVIIICMKVTPENTERLLAIQDELSPRGYKLDPRMTQVWSYPSDEDARAKALALVPECVAAIQRDLKKDLPDLECRSKKWPTPTNVADLRYEFPATKIHGTIRVWRITPEKHWESQAETDEQLYLPHLGLMIQLFYRPSELASNDRSVRQAAIRKVFDQAVQPFLKLEPGAVIESRSETPPLPPPAIKARSR
jgi:hypothetical protein